MLYRFNSVWISIKKKVQSLLATLSDYIISGYTGMMLTVDCSLFTASTVNSELEFTIPMLTDLILGVGLKEYYTNSNGTKVENPLIPEKR